MYIKIYFGDKPVFLCDELTKELNEILHHPDAVFVDEINGPAIKSLLHEIKKEEFHAGVLWNEDIEKLKKAFFKQFTLIEAAGGIIQNDKKELLMIFRLGKWDLPKGKLEKGEKLEECAVREVEEETGVKNITLNEKAGETYHAYNAFGKHFLKISHWYYMSCDAKQELVPQTEEDITEIKWVKITGLKDVLSNTYPSIKDILSVFDAQ
jgi:8-oxo-dGTP pyrophosphatase MutT (NUDIX family)